MTGDARFNREIPKRQVAEVLGAVALILWRIWDAPLRSLWQDWVALLACYWLIDIAVSKSGGSSKVALGAMAALMALYGWGVVANLLALWHGSS